MVLKKKERIKVKATILSLVPPDTENSKEIITVDYEMSGMHVKGCGISSFACVVARMSSGQV